MTIDEEIKHCEKLAERQEEFGKKMGDIGWFSDSSKRYIAENRQLAEWLKELKAYKDFEDKGYVMCRFEVAQDDRHRTTKMVLDFSTRELFDNVEEVNADEDGH